MKLFYTQNVGSYDRLLRIIIGLAGVIVADIYKLNWLNIIATIVLLTGFFGWCGMYSLRGISTVATKKAAPKKAKKAAGKAKKKK